MHSCACSLPCSCSADDIGDNKAAASHTETPLYTHLPMTSVTSPPLTLLLTSSGCSSSKCSQEGRRIVRLPITNCSKSSNVKHPRVTTSTSAGQAPSAPTVSRIGTCNAGAGAAAGVAPVGLIKSRSNPLWQSTCPLPTRSGCARCGSADCNGGGCNHNHKRHTHGVALTTRTHFERLHSSLLCSARDVRMCSE
jgi:hypothetical protein